MLNLKLTLASTAAALMVVAAPLAAQGKSRRAHDSGRVPPGQLPPAGMCRIWIDGVPPGQQPAPTDCVTAERNRPSDARVLHGDDQAFPGRGRGKWKGNAATGDRDDGRYDTDSGRIGSAEPRVGREDPRVGRRDPRVDRRDPRTGRDTPRVGRDTDRVELPPQGNDQARVHRPDQPRTRNPGTHRDSTATRPPISTRPRTRPPLL